MREEFMIERQGKTFVLFAGLLDEAHARFTKSFDMQTQLVDDGMETNTPIVKARFEGIDKDDKVVRTSGIGDASPEAKGAGNAEKGAPIRMAETRAKARALRDAINVGATALEEMPENDSEGNLGAEENSTRAPSRGRQQRGRRRQKEEPEAELTTKQEVGALAKKLYGGVNAWKAAWEIEGNFDDLPEDEQTSLLNELRAEAAAEAEEVESMKGAAAR